MARLFVGNLPLDSNEDDVRRVFSGKADIRDLTVKSGYAFVEFADADTADSVRRDLDGSDFGGKNMRIDRAKPKPEREERRRDDRYGGGAGGAGGYGERRAPPPYGEDRRGGYGGGGGDRYGGGGGGYGDDRRGGYGDDRRGGYEERPRYGDRGGYGDDRRGGYGDDRRGGYGDRRGGFGDRPPRNFDRPQQPQSEFVLIVDGLGSRPDWRDVKDHFRPMGANGHVAIRGSQAIVPFDTEEALLAALKTAEGTSIRGTPITVSRQTRGAPSSSDAHGSPPPRDAPESPAGN